MHGEAYETRFVDLARALGTLGVWVRLHYVYPVSARRRGAAADGRWPRAALPRHPVPARQPDRAQAHEPAGACREHARSASTPGAARCPELTLRSSFIVGFPGETDAEFEELLDWLDEAQLDRVGCFRYSPVEGATANDLPDPVPADVMDERYARFMERAAAIIAARLAAKVGRELTVLVDRVDGNDAIARTAGDAPEIDGVVNVKQARQLRAGEFATVKITTAGTYDLAAVPA